MNAAVYNDWVSRNEPGEESLSFEREMLEAFTYLPRVSVLMVVSDPDEVWIKRSVASVQGQTYPYFELCVCDNASNRPHVSESLTEFAASDGHVRVHRLQEPVGLAEAYNQALSLATGEFVILLDAGDELAADALFSVVELLQNVESDVVYADEDSIDIADRRSAPIFKPYWSPDLLLSSPYVGRLCAIRRELVEKAGRFREGFERAEEYDLLLRVSGRTRRIQHIPRMLYHRRTYGEEQDHSINLKSLRRAVRGALKRKSEIELQGFVPGSSRPIRGVSGQPTVSVVALILDGKTAGNAGDLAEQSTYPVHEVILTGPGDPSYAGEPTDATLAEMVNRAAGEATGDYLLFLRNYQEATKPGWILELLRQAQRPEVGAVGGQILNAGGSIRTAGSVPNLNKLIGGPPNAIVQEEPSHFLPVVAHPFNPGTVSSECMMIRRSTFEELGGFDEALPTAFYDLDLSFRLAEKGLLNVYVPEVSLFAAGVNRPLPEAEEIAYMWRRWWAMLARELHYADSPLESGYGTEYELPPFLQVQFGSEISK